MDGLRPHLKVPGEIERDRASGPAEPLLSADEIEVVRRATCAPAGRYRDHGPNARPPRARITTALLRVARDRRFGGAGGVVEEGREGLRGSRRG